MKPTPILVLTALLLTAASAVDAQVRRGRQPEESGGTPWAPIAVGLRVGWDQESNGEVLGAQLRIPVMPSGVVEFAPNAEVIFLDRGAKEYQYNLEAALLPGGAGGGPFGIAGIGWRNTVLTTTASGDVGTRDTLFGFVLGGGIKAGLGRLQLEFSFRWVLLNDTDFGPNSAALGVNYPLWQTPRRVRP